jgi:Rne/Rng family ribonuclease
MNKELFVSSTPHETKVGMVEDDQLAEIYLERENEYTLAGSIYKGRVTRVLPGMQSAFVDIGLERDAFLYVSDFMELEDSDEVDELPASPVVSEPYRQPSRDHIAVAEGTLPAAPTELSAEVTETQSQPAQNAGSASASDEREDRGGFRGRRRRRGGRGRERMPDSKFARPSEPAPEPTRETPREAQPFRGGRPERDTRDSRSNRNDFGPPPGYQPILLPGESISKYQRRAPAQPLIEEPHRVSTPAQTNGEQVEATGRIFPYDEPLFTQPQFAQHEPEGFTEISAEAPAYDEKSLAAQASESANRDAEVIESSSRFAAFGRVSRDEEAKEADDDEEDESQRDEEPEVAASPDSLAQPAASAGTLVEEEIEEEEADIAHYMEDLEEDETFEEMEEETRAAEDLHESSSHEIAAAGEPINEISEPLSAEPLGGAEGAELASGQETVDEAAENEAELEEAQAEAEALLDAEARGNGTADARVEVRAPAPTAPYTQRAQRPAYDRQRRGGFRGGRGGHRPRRDNTPTQQISDLLKEGQEILVQIAKEPIGKKGARITSHIALPGRFLVYMPTVNHTGVSRKIASEEERQRLKRIILSERENGHGGFIVRTAAMGASEDELRADIRFLKGLWTEIKTRAEKDKSPLLIYHDLNVVERVLRDQVTSGFNAIWVDTEQEYERILRFANRFQPSLVKRVKLYSKETPLFEQFGLSEEINKALKSKVWLKSGGYIVINQTEALVAIDVNTGKYVGKTTRLEDTIVKTNVDAIKEIVRQIRLRDLGGIIIIDFIDMDERRNRQKVMQALEEALRDDRAPSKVLQFNDFGLVAITRKRVKQSLERTIGSPCPYCESTGFVKSVTTVCNDIYLEMRKMAKHLEHADVMLRVNPEVGKALKSNNGRALLEMEELTKKTVIVKSDPALHQEQFDIN